MAIRLTVFFSQTAARSMGWSENYWKIDANDLSPSTQNACAAFISELLASKGPQTIGIGHRITVYDDTGYPTGISQTFTPPGIPDSNTSAFGGTASESDYPTVSLLLECRAENGRSTRQWMHGLQDGSIQRGGVFIPSSIYKSVLNSLTSYMNRNGWGMKVLNRTASPKVRLFSISPAVPHVFTTVTPHGLTAGQLIKIYRAYDPNKTGVNGTWHVAIPTSSPESTFLAIGYLPIAEATVLANGASYIKKQIFQFVAGQWQILRATSRQVGRPFGSPSGRRRGIKRSQI